MKKYQQNKNIQQIQKELTAQMSKFSSDLRQNLFSQIFYLQQPQILAYYHLSQYYMNGTSNLTSLMCTPIRMSSGNSETHITLSQQQSTNQFDLLFKYPADVQGIAQLHKKNKNFSNKKIRSVDPLYKCPCCPTQYDPQPNFSFNKFSKALTPQPKTLLNMKSSRKSLSQSQFILGSEIVAYFNFIKIIIGYLLLRFIVLDVFLIINKYFEYSAKPKSYFKKQKYLYNDNLFFQKNLPMADKLQIAFEYYNTVAFLMIVFVVVSLIYFAHSRRYQMDLYQAIEASQHYESKYSVLVQNIPLIPIIQQYKQARFQDISYQKRLSLYFSKFISKHLLNKVYLSRTKNKQHLQTIQFYQEKLIKLVNSTQKEPVSLLQSSIVKSVNIVYDISALKRLQQEKIHYVHQTYNIFANIRNFQHLKKLNKNHKQIIQKFQQSDQMLKRLPYFLNSAIITFNYQLYRDFLIQKFEQQPQLFQMNGKQLIIKLAQKPSVIEWGNFNGNKKKQFRARIYINMILFLILLFAFFVLSVCELKKVIPRLQKKFYLPKHYQHRISNLILSGITTLINYAIFKIILILATSEKRLSKTGIIISLLTKNVISQFINSALIYYFITFVTPSHFLLQMKELRERVESFILIPGTLKIFTNFINVPYLIKKFQLYIKGQNLIQRDFNELFERPEFDFVNKYTYYIVQLMTVSFYASLSPLIVPGLAFIFLIQHFIDKLILFNKSSSPQKVSYKVTNYVQFLCECSLLIFMIGWINFAPIDLWTPVVKISSYLSLMTIAGYLGYRYRTMKLKEQLISQQFISNVSHNSCQNILLQKYSDYNPWKRYYKTQRCEWNPQMLLPKKNKSKKNI